MRFWLRILRRLRSIVALLWGIRVVGKGRILRRLRDGLGLIMGVGIIRWLGSVGCRLILRRLRAVTLVVVVGFWKRSVGRRVGVVVRLDISRA